MRIRTPADLGALIRDHRTRLGLDQKSLAEKVGVSRLSHGADAHVDIDSIVDSARRKRK